MTFKAIKLLVMHETCIFLIRLCLAILTGKLFAKMAYRQKNNSLAKIS